MKEHMETAVYVNQKSMNICDYTFILFWQKMLERREECNTYLTHICAA